MKRWLIALAALVLAAAGPALAAWHSILQVSLVAASPGLIVDLNFASNSASGCSTLTSCLTVTRTTAETCTDASGAITYQTSGNACITSGGLQVWEASTNLLTQSALASGWTSFAVTPTINATPPDGVANTATTLDEGTTTAQHDIQSPTISFTNGTSYVTSCFVKAGTRGFAQLTQNSGVQTGAGATRIDLSTGVVSIAGSSYVGGSIAYANGWWRVWAKWTATASTTASVIIATAQSNGDGRLPNYTGTSGTILVWGCQAEATVSGVTPYIPTTTVSVTRNADNIAVTGGSLLATTLNAATGTVVANTSGQNAGLSAIAASLVSANGIVLLGKTTGGNGTTAVGATLSTSNTSTWTATSDLGLAWNASGGALQLDGGTIATDATARTPATAFALGSTSGSSAFFDGNITRLRAYNTKQASPQ